MFVFCVILIQHMLPARKHNLVITTLTTCYKSGHNMQSTAWFSFRSDVHDIMYLYIHASVFISSLGSMLHHD